MGLFFFGKSGPKATNRVWMTADACLKGLTLAYFESVKRQEHSVVVTVFEESHDRLIHFLEKSGITVHVATSLVGYHPDPTGMLIVKCFGGSGVPSGAASVANVFILGRYPFLIAENNIVDGFAEANRAVKITFALSLDDAIFEVFGSENLKGMMIKLGMKEDEPIEHSFIDKSISNALANVNKELVVETKSRSEKDWYLKNKFK